MNNSELERRIERHHRAAYGWALSCCYQDPGEAEEVLQAVYLKILEGKARFGGRSAFRTWFFSVIRRTAIDRHRRRRIRRQRLVTMTKETGCLRSTEGPEEEVDRSQVRDMIRRAMKDLPVRQREVIQLVFYHELSLREAARVMEVSIGSARTHYERGKKNLRQWLEKRKVSDEFRQR